MRRTFLGLVVPLLYTTAINAQKIEKALTIFNQKFPAEKIYIHYNKEFYTAGETIWFKAYLTINHQPSGLSNNFYLQLTDDAGNVVNNNKYPVTGGTVSGHIDIPDSIAGGIFSVKAFTPAMLIPDADFIYTKSIRIYSATRKFKDGSIQNLPNPKILLHFFPEGGNLISDIHTVVAFKAINEFGYPVDITGIIQAENSSISIPFKSFHDGMGQVRFKPQFGKKYVAITEINGKAERFYLPTVQASGLKLTIEEKKGSKLFIVSRDKRQQLNINNFKVVAQINNSVVYEKDFYFGSHYAVQGIIITDSLPSGILHVTIFNNEDAPMLERLTFVNNREYEAGVILSLLKHGINPREINTLEFDFPDLAQRSCSVAVTDYQADSAIGKENIISSILLSSDIKGSIYNPGYYFSSQNDSVKTALENLMLTHGWRRFNWKKVLQNEYPEPHKVDEFLINISGTVKNQKNVDEIEGGVLTIFIVSEDSTLLSYNFPVKENGRFVLDSLLFTGSAKFYYSYTNTKGRQKPVTVFLDEKKTFEWSDIVIANKIPEVYTKPEFALKAKIPEQREVTFIQNGIEKEKELENVTVLSKPNRPIDILNEKYATGFFRTGSKYIIDNITKPEVLTGAGPDAVSSFIYHRLPLHVGFYKGSFFQRRNGSPIAVFINEVQATTTELNQLRIEQIAIVKFFDMGSVVGGFDNSGGSIAIYTKKNDDIKVYNSKSPDAPYFTYKGYSIEKEFYSPDYSIPSEKNSSLDTRTTLYWNPRLYTSTNEKSILINFYNNDVSKKLKIVLEGVDNKGRLIFLERIIGQ